MDLAAICLFALFAILVLSCLTAVNVGLLAIGAAWIIGVYVAPHFGEPIGVEGVARGFPTDLFLTLTGTTLLFACAQANGALNVLVGRGVALCGRRAALVPVAFFFLTMGLAAGGAGNIAPVALIAPSAMALARRLQISPFLMILAVAHGSIAGGLSPISPIGIVVLDKLRDAGLADAAPMVCGYNVAANCAVAAIGFCFLHGRRSSASAPLPVDVPTSEATIAWNWRHKTTLAAIGLVFGAVIFGGVHLGLAAIAATGALLLVRAGDEKQTLRATPWNVVLMVCGVSMLVKLAENVGALELFARLLAHVATAQTINGWMALITGGISIFSSTSGVVLPTFLPMVPDLVRETGGGDPRSLATAIAVGSNLVDVSPLSTIGALCIAAAAESGDTRRLFNQLLVWGIAMAPVAAILCQFLIHW